VTAGSSPNATAAIDTTSQKRDTKRTLQDPSRSAPTHHRADESNRNHESVYMTRVSC
jgi:hypothetical protein